jgi:hypothetical protein
MVSSRFLFKGVSLKGEIFTGCFDAIDIIAERKKRSGLGGRINFP